MSKVFKNYIERMSLNEILTVRMEIDHFFKTKFDFIRSDIPELYTNKEDYWDLDYFVFVKDDKNIDINSLKLMYESFFWNWSVLDIYKSDIEFTALLNIKWKNYHIDTFIIWENTYSID